MRTVHCFRWVQNKTEHLACGGGPVWYVCSCGMVKMEPETAYKKRCTCVNYEIYRGKPTWF